MIDYDERPFEPVYAHHFANPSDIVECNRCFALVLSKNSALHERRHALQRTEGE